MTKPDHERLQVFAINRLVQNTLTGLYLSLALVDGVAPAVLERTRLATAQKQPPTQTP